MIVSVFEASATRRDAKGYLQKYAPKNVLGRTTQFVQGKESDAVNLRHTGSSNVAIVKLRDPAGLKDDVIEGIANSLSQLRLLGLLAVVVLDCGPQPASQSAREQAYRLSEAIDSFGKPGSKVATEIFMSFPEQDSSRPRFLASRILVEDGGVLRSSLKRGFITVIPPLASSFDGFAAKPHDPDQLVLALTRHFAGLHMHSTDTSDGTIQLAVQPSEPVASVERIIILDPMGGTPRMGHPSIPHRFVNLEQEFEHLIQHISFSDEAVPTARTNSSSPVASAKIHTANLRLAKEALSFLPATSSALITTPSGASGVSKAREKSTTNSIHGAASGHNPTRKRQNPLLHNLLTDKPIFSSSLPIQRMQSDAERLRQAMPSVSDAATLLKRGMPVSIYPNPRESPWQPPKPGSPRLRLTDKCIDLPRLMHLIEDSFGRKIDVQDYLNRVNDNLAGVIIAGEYEGGAILTWERPYEMSESQAWNTSHFVPYLDKFAVLKSRQGSGGVADIVFNAMVQDCFPNGVCWRSRKDNPVNKWYFERSAGTRGLSGSNWKMFWTTPNVVPWTGKFADYEAVCRGVEPSWADNKHILD